MSRLRAGQARANQQEAAVERTRAAHAMDSNKGKTKPMAELGGGALEALGISGALLGECALMSNINVHKCLAAARQAGDCSLMSNIIVHKCLAAAEQARECALTHNINVHKWLAAAEEAAEGVAYLVMSDPEDPEPATVTERRITYRSGAYAYGTDHVL
jgi:hypothetical protein